MTALGVNATDRDPTYSWADVRPTHRPENKPSDITEGIWQLRNQLINEGVETGNPDYERIASLATLAKDLENIARGLYPACDCPDPDHRTCPACRIVERAKAILDEELPF